MHNRFWIRATTISTNSFQRRFLASWEHYLKGTAQQAEDRSCSHICTVSSYLKVRRQTIGVMPSLAFFQIEMDKALLKDGGRKSSLEVEMDIVGGHNMT
ncbi:hypothetical protein BKA67DRAFT_415560 [Truncatella angustata]|uniref:Uncharacterized protein n=1 Tax=Truncatella angustata TaxID=152316 RepID=A0A9P8RIP3_9PEZI|nr:uncharacterized protein BKA67DRAFT_415560 [Truncatella angustata]KAH6646758.1 hypothetical protein BKA67DRAFT_415560 [Truncatella angustata]